MSGQDTSFNPAVHGWPFANSGWDEARIYEVLGVPIYSTALCGGMALAALDFFTHNINIPRTINLPSIGDPLYNYIVQRQRDSLGAMIPGFTRYVAHSPFESHHARWQELVREDKHLGVIQRRVAQNKPIILGLLNRYVGIPTSPQNSHHQVLAIGWEKRGPRWCDVRIKIYDPNHPNQTVILVPIEGAGPPLDRFGRSDYDRYVPTLDGTLDTIISGDNFWGAGFPHDGLLPQKPYDRVPLNLYWNEQRGDNFTAATEAGRRGAEDAGYAFVRTEGYIYPSEVPGSVPLNLYWNEQRGDNFTAATEAGRRDAEDAGYSFVRTEGYIYPSEVPGSVPLNLYWNEQRGDNFTAATEAGRRDAEDAGYAFVRTEGYILPTLI